MSQLPAPPVLPKPKSMSKVNDAATAAHDALLRLVWRNLDGIMVRIFSKASSDFEAYFSDAIETYLGMISTAAERVHQHANGSAEGLALAERLLSVDAKFVPSVPDELFAATVSHKTLAAPVIEYKAVSGTRRATQVGFVDIECQVGIPDRIKIDNNLPWALALSHGALLSGGRLERRFVDDDMRKTPEAPRWEMEREMANVWIDVRVTIPPLGQLLRELKNLRNYATGPRLVIVVLPAIDSETASCLKSEDFVALSAEWIKKNGFV